jgi:hypothetical protein
MSLHRSFTAGRGPCANLPTLCLCHRAESRFSFQEQDELYVERIGTGVYLDWLSRNGTTRRSNSGMACRGLSR